MKMSNVFTRYRRPLFAVLLVLLGLMIGKWIFGGTAEKEARVDHAQHDIMEQIWTCSMHPQIRMNEPGSCPICGMDLIPAASNEDAMDPAAVHMTAAAMQLANVQTIVVGSREASNSIRLTGKVVPDERRVFAQAAHVPGRVEDLLVNYTGEHVRKGQELARIYSPELVTAQEELLQAYRVREAQPALYNAARKKLSNWKMTDAQIDAIINAGETNGIVPILADVKGVVVEKRTDPGDYLKRGEVLYQVADLSKLWILFDLYESDLATTRKGDTVEFTVRSLPGKKYSGRVTFIDPVVDPATRVAQARVEVRDPDPQLKPGMFTTGIVRSQHRGGDKHGLVIPRSAVLWTGPRSVVYVKVGEGQFRMSEVVLGNTVGDNVSITSGLEVGEEVVVNGAFTVDAAAQLNGMPSMMSPEGGPMPEGHDHGAAK